MLSGESLQGKALPQKLVPGFGAVPSVWLQPPKKAMRELPFPLTHLSRILTMYRRTVASSKGGELMLLAERRTNTSYDDSLAG